MMTFLARFLQSTKLPFFPISLARLRFAKMFEKNIALKNMIQQTSNNIELEYDCWLEEQIDCLKSQNFAGLDLINLIEELESLGRAEKSAVKSFTLQIIIHLLLIDYWSEESLYNKNHWEAEVNILKFQLTDRLTTNLKLLLKDNLDRIYSKARTTAILKSHLNSDRFPEICPYTLEDLIDQIE